ncbi:MAG: hypothetical protein HC857_17855 [Synechococcales cyanobacterium RU_4_20]|nr:hypothetical protein [Synechococcales cyanobacterium RU_4_20]NJR71618.1 hypothetical protein [Synechococcales cyanobacterium CRU_2_2]
MKTWQIIAALAAVGIFWSASNGGDIGGALNQLQDSQQIAAETDRLTNAERDRTREQRRLSRIALDRYKAGCVPVVHAPSGSAKTGFLPGDSVRDAAGANRQLRDGTAICNQAGDTAISINGTAQQPASVSLDDAAEFQQIQAQIQQLRSQP